MPYLPIRKSEFYPLTLTMAPENILFGAKTLRTRWHQAIGQHSGLKDRWIDPTVLPNDALTQAILSLDNNQILKSQGSVIAAHLPDRDMGHTSMNDFNQILNQHQEVDYVGPLEIIESLQFILDHNTTQIVKDFETVIKTDSRFKHPIFRNSIIHPSVSIQDVVIDDRQGPVLIGAGATILPGARILGPVVILEKAVVKMGAELYPGTVVGPHSVVSGEIKNSVIHEYSAKGHVGYLGDSILGRWNNLGSGTTVSNVSNTFSKVQITDWETNDLMEYNSVKRGVITGDFVKLGIQSKVFRGTAIGSFTSIATLEAIQGNVPSLSWWTEGKKTKYMPDLLRVHCQNQMALRGEEWMEYWEDALTGLISGMPDPKISNRE